MLGSGADGKKSIKEVEKLCAQNPKLERVSSELTKHKNVDEELYKAQAGWEKTFDAITDWVAITNLKGRILRTNHSGEDFTGISSAQIVGQSCCKLVHGSEGHIPGCPLQKMLQTRQRERVEFKVQDANRWLIVTVDPVTDKEGNIVSTVHITRDITDRKKAEAALRESEERFRTLFESTREGLLTVDPDGRVISANPAAAKMLGYKDPQDLVGMDTVEFYADQKQREVVLKELKDNDYLEDYEVVIKKKDGMHAYVLASITTQRDEEGNILRTIGTLRDIAGQKKAAEEIAWLAKFPMQNPNPLLRVAKDGTIIYCNTSSLPILKLWQCQQGERLSGQWYDFIVETLSSDEPKQTEARCDGSVYLLTFASVKDSDFVNVYGLDITDRKKAVEEARDAQQKLIERQRHEKEHVEAELAKVRDELVRRTRLAAIGQVSASIAHDLRNPLGAVRNASYFLRRRLSKDEPKASEHLKIIDQEVAKADQIITNLLEMARPKASHKQVVDLAEIVKQVFGQAKGIEGVSCRTLFVPDPFMIQTDPNQLRQAISNIMNNAVYAMKGHGEFLVEATRDSDYDTLVFRDTGPGFDPEVRDRLFEPLVTTKASGTGLGLAICRQIVEKHGGTIHAEDCKGGGAVIRIRLPRQ